MADAVLAGDARLSYRYPEARADALRGVDLRVEPGEFVVLAGRSGSGKSTLLRAACGLVPHFHGGEVEGELEVAGMDVRSHGPAELAEAVGLVAQEPETQVVSTTVRPRSSCRSSSAASRRRRAPAPSRRSRSRWRSTGCSSGPRTRSPAASSSESRWRPRSSPGRASFCSTSRPRSSTRSPGTS